MRIFGREIALRGNLYINHMNKTGGGGLPNVPITTEALFSKIIHKGGGGQKDSKKLSTWFMNDP